MNVKCGVGRERGLKPVLLHDREEGEDEGKFCCWFVSRLEEKGEKRMKSMDRFVFQKCFFAAETRLFACRSFFRRRLFIGLFVFSRNSANNPLTRTRALLLQIAKG